MDLYSFIKQNRVAIKFKTATLENIGHCNIDLLIILTKEDAYSGREMDADEMQ